MAMDIISAGKFLCPCLFSAGPVATLFIDLITVISTRKFNVS